MCVRKSSSSKKLLTKFLIYAFEQTDSDLFDFLPRFSGGFFIELSHDSVKISVKISAEIVDQSSVDRGERFFSSKDGYYIMFSQRWRG